MTYKGIEVGIPTLEQINEYIKKRQFKFEAEDVFKYWEKRGWKSPTLEHIVVEFHKKIYDKIAYQRKNANKKGELKLKRTPDVIARIGKIVANGPVSSRKKVSSLAVPAPQKKTNSEIYQELLKDPKWKAFRTFVFAVRGKSCEACGCDNHLQVHHPKYICGRKPWEYTCNEVVVLCNSCHEKVHVLS